MPRANSEDAKIYLREYRLKNQDRVKDNRRKYYEENKEDIKAKSREYNRLNKERINKRNKDYRSTNLDKVRAREKQRLIDKPESYLYYSAKRRAKKKGIPFNIELSDIVIPEFCPVLGIELKRGDYTYSPNSPSLDKIKPELGYVKGNILVVSWRANHIKTNATVEELRKVYDFYHKREMEMFDAQNQDMPTLQEQPLPDMSVSVRLE